MKCYISFLHQERCTKNILPFFTVQNFSITFMIVLATALRAVSNDFSLMANPIPCISLRLLQKTLHKAMATFVLMQDVWIMWQSDVHTLEVLGTRGPPSYFSAYRLSSSLSCSYPLPSFNKLVRSWIFNINFKLYSMKLYTTMSQNTMQWRFILSSFDF